MRIKTIILVGLCFMVSALSAQTPFATHGVLKVSGNKIQDKNSQNFQLRGMSFFWGDVYQEGRKYWNADVLDWLVRDWKVNVVRVPVGIANTTDWTNTGVVQTAAAKTMIDLCYAQGIYVIIDWHTSLDDDQTKANAKTFFTDIATYAAGKGNVIYELYNEPLEVSWSSIQSYANQVVPLIRAHDANGIIVVGTPSWSSRVDYVGYNRVSGSNIAYTLHFYAGEGAHSAYRGYGESAMNSGNAVFVTEWGTSAADGGVNSTYINTSESDTWINWMSSNNVSWANWTVSHKNESSSIFATAQNNAVPAKYYFGGWDAADLKATGIYVRGKLRAAAGFNANAWDTPKSSSSTTASSSSVATIEVGKAMVHSLPGRVEAEDYQQAIGVKTELTKNDAAGDSSLGYIDAGDWAEYQVNCTWTANYVLNARVAVPTTGNGSLISVNVDGNFIQEIPLYSTGGYTTWGTITTNIQLTEGAHTIHLDFLQGSGTKATGFFNLNWLEFLADGPSDHVLQPAAKNLGISVISSNRSVDFEVPNQIGPVALTMLDLHGTIVAKQMLTAGETRLDCSRWGHGMYWAVLRARDGSAQHMAVRISR